MDETKIKELIEAGLDRQLDSLDMDANLYLDLGLDSMGAVAMFVALQRSTRIEITPEEAPSIQTGRQLLNHVLMRLSEREKYEENATQK